MRARPWPVHLPCRGTWRASRRGERKPVDLRAEARRQLLALVSGLGAPSGIGLCRRTVRGLNAAREQLALKLRPDRNHDCDTWKLTLPAAPASKLCPEPGVKEGLQPLGSGSQMPVHS